MMTHSVAGFKPKKFDLVHHTVFLVRGVVWARGYRKLVIASRHIFLVRSQKNTAGQLVC